MGRTLKFDIGSQFWGKFEGIWGNPGEIPHIGWKIWSKRLKYKYLKKKYSKLMQKHPQNYHFLWLSEKSEGHPFPW